ncbi:MAG: IS630 family transposase [Actinomycetota bacterium]
MWSVAPLEISSEERAELERRVRSHTASQRAVRRARIALLAADGVPNRKIATEVGMDEHNVSIWRRRFEQERLAGLKDRPRPGRPSVYGHDDRLKIVATVTTVPPDPASHWSHSQLADVLEDEVGISASQIGRILAELDIKPHLVQGWITRSDNPDFWERAADVCGLYLNPPKRALVLSVDEKSQIGVRSRNAPDMRVTPGRPERHEHHYIRHGVAHLIAALDVHNGGIFAADGIESTNSTNFCHFLDDINAKVPKGLSIHVVLDNGSSHISKETKKWLSRHKRFHIHYTPTGASWLNQVELFFSILTRRLIKRGSFASREEMIERIMAFIADYNRTAKPFAWTYDGKPLKAA